MVITLIKENIMKPSTVQFDIWVKTLIEEMEEDGIISRSKSQKIKDHFIWNAAFYINMVIIFFYVRSL